MLACGALRDPALLPKYEGLLFPKNDGGDAMASDDIARAASWAVAKLGDKKAMPLLKKIAQNGTSDMRAFAVLGLGLLKDKSSVPLLAQTARSMDTGGPVARAAAAYALGEVGAESETTTLVTLAEGTDALPRQMAILALARLGMHKGEPPGGRAALAAMADAVFAGEAEGGRGR